MNEPQTLESGEPLDYHSGMEYCPAAAENAKLLSLWKEAQGYGWRLTNERPFYNIGSTDPHPTLRLFSVAPPSDSDERTRWAGIWTNVAVIDEITRKRKYYISFPHWFEKEVGNDRSDRMSWSDWMWDMSWGRFAATGEGFSN